MMRRKQVKSAKDVQGKTVTRPSWDTVTFQGDSVCVKTDSADRLLPDMNVMRSCRDVAKVTFQCMDKLFMLHVCDVYEDGECSQLLTYESFVGMLGRLRCDIADVDVYGCPKGWIFDLPLEMSHDPVPGTEEYDFKRYNVTVVSCAAMHYFVECVTVLSDRLRLANLLANYTSFSYEDMDGKWRARARKERRDEIEQKNRNDVQVSDVMEQNRPMSDKPDAESMHRTEQNDDMSHAAKALHVQTCTDEDDAHKSDVETDAQRVRRIHHEIFGDLSRIDMNGTLYFVARELAAQMGYQCAEKMLRCAPEQEVKSLDDLYRMDIAADVPERDNRAVSGRSGRRHVMSDRERQWKTSFLTCLGKNPKDGNAWKLRFISQAGVNAVLGKSEKPMAAEWQQWAFGEVLVSVQKTGGYSISSAKPRDSYAIEDPIERALAWVEEEKERRRLAMEADSALKALSEERARADEAVQKRSYIQHRRECTAMQTASNMTRENARLKDENRSLVQRSQKILDASLAFSERHKSMFISLREMMYSSGCFSELFDVVKIDRNGRALVDERVKRFKRAVESQMETLLFRHAIAVTGASRSVCEKVYRAIVKSWTSETALCSSDVDGRKDVADAMYVLISRGYRGTSPYPFCRTEFHASLWDEWLTSICADGENFECLREFMRRESVAELERAMKTGNALPAIIGKWMHNDYGYISTAS